LIVISNNFRTLIKLGSFSVFMFGFGYALIPSYGPTSASAYFRKLDCFCFAKQTLAPGERRQMPVVFVVDPSLPLEIPNITLSYTFFEVEGNRRVEVPPSPGGA